MDAIAAAYDNDSSDDDAALHGGAAAADATVYGARPAAVLPGHIYLELPPALSQSAAFRTMQCSYASWFSRALAGACPAARGAASERSSSSDAAGGAFALLPAADAYVATPLHISLSRYFTLHQDAAAPFIADLRRAVAASGQTAFDVTLDGCQTFAGAPADGGSCASGRALFLGMLVGSGRESVLRLLASIDTVMTAHRLLPFYSPAEPHVSIAVSLLPRRRRRCRRHGEPDGSGDSSGMTAAGTAASTTAAAAAAADSASAEGEAPSPPPAKRRRGSSDALAAAQPSAAAAAAESSEADVGTGDVCASAAEVGLEHLPPAAFSAVALCVKLGKRVFALPLRAVGVVAN